MGKTVAKVAGVIAGVALIASGVGAIAGGSLLAAIGGAATLSTIATVAGVISLGAGMLAKKPGPGPSTISRLQVTFDPGSPRKLVYGRTALATDLRYSGYTGSGQEYYHQILCVASHQVEAIEEIWFESELAWSASGGIASKYSGYLTVASRTAGTSGNAIAIDSVWTSSARLTGCAYLHLRYKLTGNSKKAESPFSQSIPSRVTVRGKGALVPDIRIVGVDPNNQSTWLYTSAADSGRNNALQLLHYLLGWRINGLLAVGRGIPPARLDLDSFITGANLCDEAVTRAAGGTEPRYRHDGIFSEADDPGAVIASLCASMNAVLRDVGGRISLDVLHNDLAAPVASFGADDILGEELWVQTVSLDATPNVIRGRYTDPSDSALYQLVDYPEVRLASVDGIDRIETFDLAGVQSPSQAQRLAKQRLQRLQYQGRYTARLGHRAWQASQGKPVEFSHPTLGWADKAFRVESHTVDPTGVVAIALREEAAAIYAWDAEEAAAVTPAAPTVYDPLLAPIVQHLSTVAEGATKNIVYRQTTDPVGAHTLQNGDIWVDISGTPMVVKVRIGGSWQFSANYVTEGSHIGVANGATKNVVYRQTGAPASPVDGDIWVDTDASPVTAYVRVGGAWEISANYVTEGSHIGVENAADVTSNVGYGPTTISVECDNSGTPLAGQVGAGVSDTFKLIKNGTPLTAGVTWSYKVLSGTFNGYNQASGSVSLTGAGAVALPRTSFSTDTALVELTGVEDGRTRKVEITYLKNKATASNTGGSGGGTAANYTVNTSIASSSYGVVSDELIVTTGSSATSVALSGSISIAAAATPPAGQWNIELKWEMWNGSAWVLVDAVINSDPDTTSWFDVEGIFYNDPGNAVVAKTATGLSSSTSYKFRLSARHSTATTRTIYLYGDVSAQG